MSHRSRQPVVLTSFRQGSLDTYLNEWRTIRASRVISQEDQSDQDESILADPDAIWLQNVGLGKIVSQLQKNNGIEESTELDFEGAAALPKHAAVIRKRMNTLRSTIRSKHQKKENGTGPTHSGNSHAHSHSHSRGDVRNIFNSAGGPRSQEPSSHQPSASGRSATPTSSPRVSPRASPRASPRHSPHGSPRGSPIPSRHIRQHSSPSIALQSTDATASHQHDPSYRGAAANSNHSPSRSRTHSGGEASSRLAVKSASDIAERSGPLVRSSEVVRQRPKDLRTASVSTTTSESSTPTSSNGDIKLNFRSPSHTPSHSQFNGAATELPNFMVMPDALGITHVSDLSPRDLERVRSVAFLELTVTFDDHGIPLRPRRPAKVKSTPENSIFGVPLSTLLQNDQQRDPNVQIPVVFEEMLNYLESNSLDEEGLLRVPGSSMRINSLQQELETSLNNPDTCPFDRFKSTDVCSLLKQFIRDLPTPLLTREHLMTFASIADIEALKEQVRSLNLLVLLLPEVNQRVLKRLMEFLEKVTQHSENNKMDLTNVAMVIAPSLFVALPVRNTLDDVTMAAKTSHVVRLLIKYYPLLWTVPGEMLRQIRFLYDAEVKRLNPKSVQKAIRQMQHQLMDQQSTAASRVMVEPQIIRVKAPLFTRVCMAVDISTGMTAGDIVSKLQKRSRLNKDVIRKRFSSANLSIAESCRSYSLGGTESPRSVSPCDDPPASPDDVDAGEQFLFEVGGNIGERCLSHETDMSALYSVNPSAQWIIKPRDCPDLH